LSGGGKHQKHLTAEVAETGSEVAETGSEVAETGAEVAERTRVKDTKPQQLIAIKPLPFRNLTDLLGFITLEPEVKGLRRLSPARKP
jgi:hypothetical protein